MRRCRPRARAARRRSGRPRAPRRAWRAADEPPRTRPGGRDQLTARRRRPGGVSARAGAPEPRGPVPGDDNTTGGGRMTLDLTVARQMVGADLLRLRKKRGMIALAVAVVLVPLVIMTGYDVVKHASDPAHYPPAGGMNNYGRLLDLLGVYMGPVAAILIGAEAGAGDLAAGVFRDNVLTGRSRTALFLARIPAAVAVTLTVTAVAYVLGVAATFVFAGGLATPSLSLILQSVAWLALANSVVCVIALGVASLTGSRTGTITGLIAWELVLSPLVVQAASLGTLRRGLLDAVLLFLKPGPLTGPPVIPMAVAVAVVVTIAWLLVLPTLGAWRMRTRDA